MKSYSSREVIAALLADGWYEVAVVVQAQGKARPRNGQAPMQGHTAQDT